MPSWQELSHIQQERVIIGFIIKTPKELLYLSSWGVLADVYTRYWWSMVSELIYLDLSPNQNSGNALVDISQAPVVQRVDSAHISSG